MLIKLAFKPSTSKALDKEGNPGTEMVPFPMTFFLEPSPKVTFPPSSITRVSKKLLFPVMCLEHPLSRYQRLEEFAFKAICATWQTFSFFLIHLRTTFYFLIVFGTWALDVLGSCKLIISFPGTCILALVFLFSIMLLVLHIFIYRKQFGRM